MLALAAFQSAAQREPGAQLVMAGAGFMRDEVLLAARRRGLARQVHLLGRQSPGELAAIMSGADLLLVSSPSETGPTVALEALACGLPVVASPVGRIPRLVVHGRTGWVASARSAEDLAVGIGWAIRAGASARTACAAAISPYQRATCPCALLRAAHGSRREGGKAAMIRRHPRVAGVLGVLFSVLLVTAAFVWLEQRVALNLPDYVDGSNPVVMEEVHSSWTRTDLLRGLAAQIASRMPPKDALWVTQTQFDSDSSLANWVNGRRIQLSTFPAWSVPLQPAWNENPYDNVHGSSTTSRWTGCGHRAAGASGIAGMHCRIVANYVLSWIRTQSPSDPPSALLVRPRGRVSNRCARIALPGRARAGSDRRPRLASCSLAGVAWPDARRLPQRPGVRGAQPQPVPCALAV